MSQCPHRSIVYGVRCELKEGHTELCDYVAPGFEKHRLCANCGEIRGNHAEGHCLFAPTDFAPKAGSFAGVQR